MGAYVVAAITLWAAFDDQRLLCDRPADRCRIENALSSGGPGRLAFDASELDNVEVELGRGSKNREYGMPVLVLGAERRNMRRVSPDEARHFADAVNAWIHGAEPALDVELRSTRWLLLATIIGLVCGVGLTASALRTIGRLRVEIDPDRRCLVVTRHCLAARWSEKLVPIDGATDLKIEWTRGASFWDRRGHPGETRARLLLVTRSGGRALSEVHFQGHGVHLRAERELRDLLGLESQPADLQELARRDAAAHAPTTSWFSSTRGRVAAAWIGATTGWLLGMALFGAVGLLLGVLELGDSVDGWMLAVGGGGGGLSGVIFALHLTRPREPR